MTVYIVEDPGIGTLEEIPPMTAFLYSKRLSNPRESTRLIFDKDEKAIGSECSQFNEAGQPLLDVEYDEDLTTEISRKIYKYNPDGRLVEERSVFADDSYSGKRYRYDGKGNLLEEIHFTDEGDDWWIKYEWHLQWNNCCIREEHSKNGELPPKIIIREWRMENGKPSLYEANYYYPTQKYENRIVRYYDPKTKENGVYCEVYNDRGRFSKRSAMFMTCTVTSFSLVSLIATARRLHRSLQRKRNTMRAVMQSQSRIAFSSIMVNISIGILTGDFISTTLRTG